MDTFEITRSDRYDAYEWMRERVEYEAEQGREMGPGIDDFHEAADWFHEYADSRAYDAHQWADEVGTRVVEDVIEDYREEMGGLNLDDALPVYTALIELASYHYHHCAGREALAEVLIKR